MEIRDLAAPSTELVPTRASLLARLRNMEDDSGWRQFFETYHRLIYGRVRRRGVPEADAEDIVAEIISGVGRRMPAFVYDPARCSFKTWLFRVVENRIADYFRRRARSLPEAAGESGWDEEVADPSVVQPDEGWEEEWMRNLAEAAFERVRKKANPRYLQIYIYSEMEGHGAAETASHLRTTANDVYTAKHRIEKLLRQEGKQIASEERMRDLRPKAVKR